MTRYLSPEEIGDGKGSPSRIYSDQFFRDNLGMIIKKKEIDVLDFGCGSGYIREILADLGYTVNYTGLDVKKHKHFDDYSKFCPSEFVKGEAETVVLNKKFDVIVSMCALEHIKYDHQAVGNLSRFKKPDTIEINMIPAKMSFPLYLSHGYRRYNEKDLRSMFGPDVIIYRIGGWFSFLLHFFFITIPQRILGLYEDLAGIYYKLLKKSVFLNSLFSFPAVMYITVNRDFGHYLSFKEKVKGKIDQIWLSFKLKYFETKKRYFVYFHLPKTAGTAIKYYSRKRGVTNRLLTLPHYCNIFNTKFKGKVVSFGTVRNPLTWYLSLYKFKMESKEKGYNRMNNNSFSDFIDDLVLFKNGPEGIKKWHQPLKADSAPVWIADNYHNNFGFYTNNFFYYFGNGSTVEIARMENLEEDLKRIFEGEIDLRIERKINTSEPVKLADYYTPEMIKAIKEKDKRIFERFYPEDL